MRSKLITLALCALFAIALIVPGTTLANETTKIQRWGNTIPS